jgi:hypothetical protein
VVPLTGTKVWVLAAKAVPFHHWLVVVSLIATIAAAVMVVEAPELDEAVPVSVPVQSAPYVVLSTG